MIGVEWVVTFVKEGEVVVVVERKKRKKSKHLINAT